MKIENPLAFKEALIFQIISKLKEDVTLLTNSALEARQAATHEESKADNKYDTRGLEASYLAGAQAKRAVELNELIGFYKFLELRSFDKQTNIASSALIEVECQNKKSLLFMVPKGGGAQLEHQNIKVQIITPISALGEELIGRTVGETFEVKIAGQLKEYLIVDIA